MLLHNILYKHSLYFLVKFKFTKLHPQIFSGNFLLAKINPHKTRQSRSCKNKSFQKLIAKRHHTNRKYSLSKMHSKHLWSKKVEQIYKPIASN